MPWAELDASVRELVRHLPASPPSLVQVDVPRQRTAATPSSRRPPDDDREECFEALRRRADQLHDLVEAGKRPVFAMFDDLHGDLVAYRRRADGPEVRQMIDDVRLLRRRVVTAQRPAALSRLVSSEQGRGFWGDPPVGRPVERRERRSTQRRRRISGRSHDAVISPERARLLEEARELRDRATRFAAAVPQARTLPLKESQRLFLHFKNLRPHLDSETQALNDAAVRLLVQAVTKVRESGQRG